MNTGRLKSTLFDNLYLGLSVIGSLLFFFLLLLPSISAYPTLRSQINEKNQELSELIARSTKLKSIINNQNTLKNNLLLVDTAIPSKDNVPTLMTQIQRIASDSGVTLKALQFGGTPLTTGSGGSSRLASDKNIKRVQLQALIEGPFTNIQSFLNNIENSTRLITVESVTFETKKGGSAIGSTLILTSYFIDNIDLSSNYSFDFGSEELKSTLLKLKSLKVYETEVTFSGVGKSNPFE